MDPSSSAGGCVILGCTAIFTVLNDICRGYHGRKDLSLRDGCNGGVVSIIVTTLSSVRRLSTELNYLRIEMVKKGDEKLL